MPAPAPATTSLEARFESELEVGQVAVRWAIPELLGARDGSVLDLLSPDERLAAGRFQVSADAVAYAAAHALLRSTLSAYGPRAPSEWRFVTGPHGKPELDDRSASALCFSLSHARGCVVCAVTRGVPVGVDVESIDRTVDVLEVARRAFTTTEYERLVACAPSLQNERFFRSWTLKEALLKALGTGLSEPMEGFEFVIPPEGEHDARIRLAVAPPGISSDFCFEQRIVLNRYVVAIAIAAPGRTVARIELRQVDEL